MSEGGERRLEKGIETELGMWPDSRPARGSGAAPVNLSKEAGQKSEERS